MKNTYNFFIIIALSFILYASTVNAQILISDGVTITENFSIGTATSAPLPPVWKVDSITAVRTVGIYSNAATSTWRRGGDNMSTTASNGVYNYGAGDPTLATDRAVGFLSSTSATKSGNLYVMLNNNGISNITGFTIDYSVEKYRYGSNNFGYSIQLYYSYDGINWTSAGSNFLTSFIPDADNSGFANAPGVTIPVSSQLNVLVNSGSDFYLAWNYSVSGIGTITSSAQGLGIDDVSITATSVICETPSTQASNINFSNLTAYTMDVNWTNGNGSRRIVVMNDVNSFTNPANGLEYNASSIYIGSGEQVIYKGTGSAVSLSGLSANTTYYFKVFEVNCYGSSTMYNLVDTVGNPVSQVSADYCSTPLTQATNMTFSALSSHSIKVNFTNGDADFRIVVVRQGFPVASSPIDGVTYIPNSYFGLGNTIAPNEFVVYEGSGSSTTVYGLQPNTLYYFAVFEYCAVSGNGSEVYLSPALSGNQSTTSNVPSSCFEIESILVDACARAWNFPHIPSIDYEEGPNEMVRFVVGGSSLNIADMTVDWPNNAWKGICQNATTAEITQRLNNTIPIESCGKLLEPPAGIIPPESNVLLITSSDTLLNDTSYFDILGNTFETLTDTLYVIYQCSDPNNRDGHFGNYSDSSQVRTLRISFSSPVGCSDTVRYDKSLLVNQNYGYGGSSDLRDGARVDYAWDGTATYVNQGCRAPFVPLEVSTFSGSGNNSCQYKDIQLAASISGAFLEVFWTGGMGTFSSPTSINTTYTPDSSETGIVSLTLNCVSECNDTVSSTININIYAQPVPIITPSPNDTICEGKLLTLTATDGVVSGATYHWSSGETTNTITFLPTTDIYTVTATSNGCTATESIDIIVNPNPTVNLGSDTAICQGQSLLLDAGNGFTYNWFPGNITTQTLDVSSTGNYIVTITDGNGCIDIDTLTLGINNNPTPTISGNLEYCFGNNTALSTESYISYNWSNSEASQSVNVTAGTYDVTVVDSNGCTGVSSSVAVVENPLPTPTITGNNAYCENSNDTLDAGFYSSFAWSNSEVTQTIVVTQGSYIVTVTDSNGCVGISSSFDVAENPLPTPVITGTMSYCAGSNTTLDAGTFSSYLWSNSETSDTIVVTAGTYSVTVTDTNNCSATAFATVTENALPTPTISGTLSYCAGLNTTIDAGMFSNYLWSNDSTDQSIVVTAGNYSVTVTDANGCSASDNVTIVENSLPIPAINGSLTYCTGFSTTLTTGLYSSYLWSNGSTNQSINATTADNPISVTVTDVNGCIGDSSNVFVAENSSLNPVISGVLSYCQGDSTTLDAGPYSSYLWSNNATTQTINVTEGTYSVSVIDANGCSGVSSTVTVTENALPTPSITGLLSYCTGSNTNLDAGLYNSYIWSNAETTQSISAIAGAYSVTVTDTNNCSSSTSVTVTENSLPTPTITGSLTYCTGFSTTLSVDTYNSYIWSDGSNSQSITATIANNPITVTVTDANGCEGISSSVTVSESSSLNPIITGSLSYCQGSTTTLNAGTFDTYLWSNNETSQTIEATAGTYSVSVKDVNGCSGVSSTVTITENALPNPSITGDLSYCEGLNTTLDAGSFNNYLWSTSETSQSIAATAGNYSVTVTDSNNCSAVAIVTVVENANPAPSITGALTYCNGNNTTLSTGSFNSYLWSDGSTTQTISATTALNPILVTVTDSNGCTGASSPVSVSLNPDLTPVISGQLSYCEGSSTTLDAGSYSAYLWSNSAATQIISATAGTYSVSVTDSNGCSGVSSSVTVVEKALPTPNITGNFSYCIDSFTVLNAGLYNSYIWSTGDITQTIDVSTPQYYHVTVSDASNCYGKDSVLVSAYNSFTYNSVSTPTSCNGSEDGKISISVIGTEKPYSFIWNTTPVKTDSVINGIASGDYIVTISDKNNCYKSDTITVTSSENACLEIPTCFTPNNDNINDTWEIKNSNLYPNITVEVYNRWGELVFKSDGYNDNWDGTYNGKEISVSSFIYIINLNDGSEVLTGTVSIIR